MKKQYMQPTAVKVAVKGALMMHTGSIQSGKVQDPDDLQTGIKENNSSDFEAGSKDHQTNLWDKWDE